MLLGLVGKPSCGKSTFFKACTLANVAIAPYPFTTIKPNHGIGYVKIECIDKDLGVQCNPREGFCIDHFRFVPVELMDVAGLVPGASQGKGLGNQFLDDLRQADAFIHIVDSSGTTNEEGKQTQNYNPVNDIAFLEKELDLWYLGVLKKVWKTFTRTVEIQHQKFEEAVAKQFSGLRVNKDHVLKVIGKTKYNTEKPTAWTEEQLENFAHELRIISKPTIIAANKCDMPNSKENIEKIKQAYPEFIVIPCSADFELALREASKEKKIKYIPGDNKFEIMGELTEKQKQALEYIKERVLNVYGSTGVQQVLNTAVFELLKYIAVFPAGVKKLADSQGRILPDCFLIPENSTAIDFAFMIHTDLGNNFVKAIDVKTKLAIGKDHKLKHRDGIEIITR